VTQITTGKFPPILSSYSNSPEGRSVSEPAKNPTDFFPKGAIAFFVAMLAAFGLIWFGMYLLLVHRQLGL